MKIEIKLKDSESCEGCPLLYVKDSQKMCYSEYHLPAVKRDNFDLLKLAKGFSEATEGVGYRLNYDILLKRYQKSLNTWRKESLAWKEEKQAMQVVEATLIKKLKNWLKKDKQRLASRQDFLDGLLKIGTGVK